MRALVAVLIAMLPMAAGAQALPGSPGTAAVNGSGNPGLAPTYFGRTTFAVPGEQYARDGHINISGYTRGWADGTCLLGVNANPLSGSVQNMCGQGGFWDMWYRTVYPGQDSTATSFGIAGIRPVAKDARAAGFASATVVNYAGAPQLVGVVTLAEPLSPAQVAQVNGSAGPMRVQVSNGYFGYTVPAGMALSGGGPAEAASADGRTILVDNFVRAVQPGNGAAPGTPGGTAALPTLPYWVPAGTTSHGSGLGTGIYPDQVGMVNGSAPLPGYTVTIDGNTLAEVFYVGFHVDNRDIVNDARVLEFVGVNNKTGASGWDETEPFNDTIGGANITSQIMFGGCQNDDGAGNGSCGEFLYAGAGLKRVIVCANGQTTADIGGTDCVLDTRSFFGWKSTKSSGYAMWLDPGATGTPRFVIDAQGNMNDSGRIFVGAGGHGVTVAPDGTVTASAAIQAGVVSRAGLPACGSAHLGAHIYVADGRKPNEAPGRGSGVPADCTPVAKGGVPVWVSVYDHAPVTD